MFAPVGEIIHFGGWSAKLNPGPMLLQLRGSILLFIKKHRSPVQYVLACVLVSAFFTLRVPVWAVLALLPGERRKSAWQRCRLYSRGALFSLFKRSRLCIGDKP